VIMSERELLSAEDVIPLLDLLFLSLLAFFHQFLCSNFLLGTGIIYAQSAFGRAER